MKRFRQARPALVALALAALAPWLGLGVGHHAGTAHANASTIVAAEPLTTGCNQITRTGLPVGSKVSDWISQNIQPASAVLSVWHFNNASQSYQNAFFKDPNAPVDAPNFQTAVDSFFICVNAAATAP